MWSGDDTYDHLNVSGPCDLCLRIITPPRSICQPRDYYKTATDRKKT